MSRKTSLIGTGTRGAVNRRAIAFESAGYGVAASPSVMIIERRVVAWLAAAMARLVPSASTG